MSNYQGIDVEHAKSPEHGLQICQTPRHRCLVNAKSPEHGLQNNIRLQRIPPKYLSPDTTVL